MDLKFFLYFVMISPIFGDNPHPQSPQALMELDRARSAWNFGGHHSAQSNKKVALNQWARQRSTVPGSAIVNRRQGTQPKASSSTKKKAVRASRPGYPMQVSQYKPYPNPVKPGKRTKINKNVRAPSAASPSKSMAPPAAAPQTYFPHPFYNQPQQPQPKWNRGSRMIGSRSDTIMNKFRKEDLWHLDKGEGYPLKNEDLEYDNYQRNYRKLSLEANSIDNQHEDDDDHHNQMEEDQHTHQQELEKDAEKLIHTAEDVLCNENHQTGKENAPNHIHHHHHYNDSKAQSHDENKDHKKLHIAPLPRIHNPIPLGCLLTVPVFHPIRPRSHVACLLSIPGTPNLMKRRRRRSADEQQQQPPQPLLPQSQIFQMFNGNQGMSPLVTRKHYANHVGNGKTPLPQQPTNSNLKVPATIIAPPAFEKGDLLSMLMGSGGVNPNEMGTILATNSRYVRFGRGLPNSGGARNGRKLRWFSEPSNNQLGVNKSPSRLPASSMTFAPTVSSQPLLPSSSNQMPSIVKLSAPPTSSSSMVNHMPYSTPSLPQNLQAPNMFPPPHQISMMPQHQQQHPSNIATPPLPLIMNVQSAPIGSRPLPSRGPALTVPVPSSQQASNPSVSHPYQVVVPPPSGKSQKYGEGFKYSEFWKPVTVYKDKPKPRKPFKYDYYKPKYNNDMLSSSESKFFYSKVKPEVASILEPLVENDSYPSQESYNDGNIATVPQVQYYANSIHNTDSDFVGESKHNANEEMSGFHHFSSGNGQDQNTEDGNKLNNDIKTYSFAVRKNNEMKNGLNFDLSSGSSSATSSFDYKDDISSAESSRGRLYFDSHNSEGAGADSGDLRMAKTVSSRSQNFDNNNYYHSLVRKLTEHMSDPIIINVPKDGPMSNEIKK